MDDYDYLFKCLAVGDGGGGKTALIVRFSQGFFQENYKLTIGVDFAVKNLKVKDYTVKLQIWDTGGQERFQYVRPLYYKGAMGCIVLFDVTNRESFNHIPRWLDEVMKESGTIPMLLVGNKIDLESERQVSRDEAEKLAKDLNMLYTESSAKSGTGVSDVFEVLSLLMIGEKVPDDLIQPKKGKISLSTTEPLRGRKSSKKFKPAPISPPKPPIKSIKPSPLAFSNDKSSPKSKLKPKPLSSPFINQKIDMLKQKSPLPLNERSSLPEMNINPKTSPNTNNEPDWFAPKVKPKQKSKPAPISFHKQTKQPFPISIQKTKPNPKEESFSDQIFNHPQKSSPSSKSSPNKINEKYDGIQKQKSSKKNPFLSKTKRHSVPRSGLFNDIEPKIIQPVPISNSRKNSKGLAQILTNLNESIQPSKPDTIPFSGPKSSNKLQNNPKKSSNLFNQGLDAMLQKNHGKDHEPKKSEPNKNPFFQYSSSSVRPSSIQSKHSSAKPKESTPSIFSKTSSGVEQAKCPKCGAKLNKNFKFCNKCGYRIK